MSADSPGQVNRLAWRTPTDAVILICRGRTVRPSARIAAIVGTLLTLVNQGEILLSGRADMATWFRVAANYVIPYVVSSIGFLASYRVNEADHSRGS
ncbi:MAG: hypothetical protein GC156_14750 [Actinomycetales bacterium]|nr:hypothetical protein [Actinomycetales bacterium]